MFSFFEYRGLFIMSKYVKLTDLGRKSYVIETCTSEKATHFAGFFILVGCVRAIERIEG